MKKHYGFIEEYKVSELSEEAYEKAYTDYCTSDVDEFMFECNWSEVQDTIEKFKCYFECEPREWEVNAYEYHVWGVKFKGVWEDGGYECTGNRLRKFVINNFEKYYQIVKYDRNPLSKKFRTIERYMGKKRVDRCCVLTGVAWDEDILDPLYDFIDGRVNFDTAEELITACFSSLFECFIGYMNELKTKCQFEEECKCNEWTFDKEGNVFALPSKFDIEDGENND